MHDDLTDGRIRAAYERVRDDLLAQRNDRGHWTGELSTSALSTATAVMALQLVHRHSSLNTNRSSLPSLIDAGLTWLVAHQNVDGGWGDTTKSFSNISTTMLARAVLHATRERWSDASTPAASSSRGAYEAAIDRANAYIDDAGGVPALVAQYGKDKTFSVPILTHCALAGLVEWSEVQQLPFELACLPARFYKAVRLPVVSYALPALIAIGQVQHHFRPTRVPGLRQLRNASRRRSLDVLQRIQPSNGGFLEAAPLTSFVTMSLAGMGLVDHPVVSKGVEFLVNSVREDGSWPIDTNLATWVTTLSVNALGPDLPNDAREPILRWLLDQQYKEVHPYTNADPGGWSWTDLPGGVPDADDTPGAILAILELIRERSSENDDRLRFRGADQQSTPAKPQATPVAEQHSVATPLSEDLVTEAHDAVLRGVKWLLDLQNRDGGWPTFCRGWGKLPFDRSSPDITAHCLRALCAAYLEPWSDMAERWETANPRGWFFLERQQDSRGTWRPLWFGNQHANLEANSTYGTARVLAFHRHRDGEDYGLSVEHYERATQSTAAALDWMADSQNTDGGWGGDVGCPSSVEETALAVEVLLSDPSKSSQLAARRGLLWLIERVEDGTYREPAPIGFYFAKLWYFERLYPLIFTVAALRRACQVMAECET